MWVPLRSQNITHVQGAMGGGGLEPSGVSDEMQTIDSLSPLISTQMTQPCVIARTSNLSFLNDKGACCYLAAVVITIPSVLTL